MPTTLQQSVTKCLIVAPFVESSLYAINLDCQLVVIIDDVSLKSPRYHQLNNLIHSIGKIDTYTMDIQIN
jgi:hypothetical protein